MLDLRNLFEYQQNCLVGPDNDVRVHQTIAAATLQAHAIMQQCLWQVIDIEGWDRATLDMPAHLRQRQVQEAKQDAP